MKEKGFSSFFLSTTDRTHARSLAGRRGGGEEPGILFLSNAWALSEKGPSVQGCLFPAKQQKLEGQSEHWKWYLEKETSSKKGCCC